jgi:type I restriction enzyme R subunit
MRPINSVIEFKQIIGRGTRLFENKDYFTIYDFVKAYEHFNDPDWDGEPEDPEPCNKCGHSPCQCEPSTPEPCPVCGQQPCICPPPPPSICPVCESSPCICINEKIKVRLSDGKERAIQHMSETTFWSPDGKPISAAEFVQRLFGSIPDLFKNEEELRKIWSNPKTRSKLLKSFEEKGFGIEQFHDLKSIIDAENSDIYDVLAYVAYDIAPISRTERVSNCRDAIFSNFNDTKQQEFLDFVLNQYIEEGVEELDIEKLKSLLVLKYKALTDAVAELGQAEKIKEIFIGFQQHLYLENA